MRLWSTVVTQLVTRPRRQSARYVAALAATRGLLVDVALHVGKERLELPVGPAPPDRRHVVADRLDPVLPVQQQLAQALGLRQQRAARDRRSVAALPLQAVAFRADAFPLAAPERLPREATDP